jgi:mannose-1-phosphate guanylyltransferase
MEAIILSGGLGTRLRPLTYARPKPLLPIANRPMLGHLLDRLPDPVDRAVLAAGYRIDDIRTWVEDNPHRVDVTVVEEEEPLGTGGAIKNVADEITGPFLCFNGDVISSAPLERMIAMREDRDAMGVLALWEVDDPQHFGVVDLDGDRITRFVEKPEPGQAPTNLINAGTYCFSEDVLDHIEAGRKVSLEHEVFGALLDDGETLLGASFEGHWVDCGRPEVYLQAHEVVLEGETMLGEDAVLDGEATDWACLGDGARVEAGARVSRSVLLDGAHVEAGAELVNTVLGEGVRVGKDARLEDTVVADGLTVDAGAELVGERVGGGKNTPLEEARFEEVA